MARTKSAQSSQRTLEEDVRNLVSAVEALIETGGHEADERVQSLRAKAEETATRARENLRVASQQVVDKGHEMTESADQYVHERPWTSIGIAAGVGVLVGMLLGRR